MSRLSRILGPSLEVSNAEAAGDDGGWTWHLPSSSSGGNQPIRQQLSREAWVLRTRPFSFFVSATYLLCQGPESRNSIQVSTNSTPSSLHFAICSGFLLSARNLGVQYGRVAMFSIELSFAHMPWQLDTTWHRYLSNATLDEQFKASQSSWFLPTSLDH